MTHAVLGFESPTLLFAELKESSGADEQESRRKGKPPDRLLSCSDPEGWQSGRSHRGANAESALRFEGSNPSPSAEWLEWMAHSEVLFDNQEALVAVIAQRNERPVVNRKVMGSTPIGGVARQPSRAVSARS